MKIDSHLHFWHYHPVKDAWITEDMALIKQDFLPSMLIDAMQAKGIDGGIAVQADQHERETTFLLALAEEFPFIKGVVGWVDLCAENIEERLEYFAQFPKLKGFRHIVQSEQQDDFLLRDDFCKGISKLAKYNFTYDILIYPKHLSYALTFVKRFPEQRFILDHIGKPFIKEELLEGWLEYMAQFKDLPNVACKIAGLVNQASWKNWKLEDFSVYLNAVLEIFGADRLMFGSDWPVCLVAAASYSDVCEVIKDSFATLTKKELAMIWGETCIRQYGL